MRPFVYGVSLFFMSAALAAAQTAGTPSAANKPAATRAPYLKRGDEVNQKYQAHRERLERFFKALSARLETEPPDLKQKLVPPAAVPFGYQILPNLLPNPVWRPRNSHLILSPFSWHRTDSIIDAGRAGLATLEPRLDTVTRIGVAERHREYEMIVDEYKKLVAGQKFMANLIEYNRLWQGEIARLPQDYRKSKSLQGAALTRQALLDSLPLAEGRAKARMQVRIASLSNQIDEGIRKDKAPEYVRASRLGEHLWVVSVPLYTDITDSAFIDSSRAIIEEGWHLRDGDDDFSVKLDLRRVSPSRLYANAVAPAKGTHIDISGHVARFPQNGAILTTGGNSTYLFGRAIIMGPHAIPRAVLVHEFGHILGFRDGYFRSYQDSTTDGYRVLEVILDSDDVVVAPENARIRRAHFEQLLKEKLK